MMRRRKPDEEVERLRADRDHGFHDLHARVRRFAEDYGYEIQMLDPKIPSSLSDRQAIAGGSAANCGLRGRRMATEGSHAALAICASEGEEPEDVRERLLADLRTVLSERPECVKWPSQTLVNALNGMEESPWPQYNHGKGFTTSNLARMLKPFGVRPFTIKKDGHCSKGYRATEFKEAFARYLPKKVTL
jgi:hypothetical protein